MRHWGQRAGGLVLLTACVALAGGCGKSGSGRIQVKGKVTIDDKVAEGVALVFYAPKEKAAIGKVTTQADGTYDVLFDAHAGEGNYQVTASRWQMKKGAAVPMGEGIDEEQLRLSGAGANTIPDRYSNPEQSGLSAVLKPGSNDKDFALKSK